MDFQWSGNFNTKNIGGFHNIFFFFPKILISIIFWIFFEDLRILKDLI